MVTRNPFMSIVPRKTEQMIGVSERKIVELTENVAKGKSILIISGGYGSGKSLVEEKIEKTLPGNVKIEKWMFTYDLINQIRSLPIEESIAAEKPEKKKFAVFIDRFELSDVVSDKDISKILQLIVEITKSGASFVISMTPKTVVRLFGTSNEFKNLSTVYRINSLTYPETKELVLSRLNEIRIKRSNSLEPFEEHELRDVWKKSSGNPRMVLLILANLYDIKKQG